MNSSRRIVAFIIFLGLSLAGQVNAADPKAATKTAPKGAAAKGATAAPAKGAAKPAAAAAPAGAAAAAATPATLPADFRTWTHTKSMVIPDKKHGLYGFHNIYANDTALATVKKGTGVYAQGSTFVVSFYDVVDEGGTSNQGAKIMDAMMMKSAKEKATGGWLYAAFDGAGKQKPVNAAKDCHACHAQGAKKTDFVFSKYIP